MRALDLKLENPGTKRIRPNLQWLKAKTTRERGRSRSPRPRFDVRDPDAGNPVEVLAACSSLGVGIVSMVGALKSNGEKMDDGQSVSLDKTRHCKVIF